MASSSTTDCILVVRHGAVFRSRSDRFASELSAHPLLVSPQVSSDLVDDGEGGQIISSDHKFGGHFPGVGRLPRLVGQRFRWHPSTVTSERPMEKQTVALLDSALDAVRRDLSPRAEALAEKSTAGTLTPEERIEYVEIVRLNDTLSLLKLQAENLLTARIAS